MNTIITLVKQDKLRTEALQSIRNLNLPQCYLAAGFVRNLVWDHLHQKPKATPLNDMDVIYFDPNEADHQTYLKYEAILSTRMPQVNWQVRNQAHMHIRNSDQAYLNSRDAMSHWPEKETAVAIRRIKDDDYECISAFGFESLFKLQITHNPKRERSIFEQRIKSKYWLNQWPMLRVMS